MEQSTCPNLKRCLNLEVDRYLRNVNKNYIQMHLIMQYLYMKLIPNRSPVTGPASVSQSIWISGWTDRWHTYMPWIVLPHTPHWLHTEPCYWRTDSSLHYWGSSCVAKDIQTILNTVYNLYMHQLEPYIYIHVILTTIK